MNAASDKVTEMTSGASKEGNKQVAKDSNASAGTRAQAGMDALGDKKDEVTSKVYKFSVSFRKLELRHWIGFL